MMRKFLALALVFLVVFGAIAVQAFAYDDSYEYDESAEAPTENLVVYLVIGAVLASIVVLIMASQLKSVRKKGGAGDYVRSGSMHLRISSDVYLYQHTTRIAKPKNNNRN